MPGAYNVTETVSFDVTDGEAVGPKESEVTFGGVDEGVVYLPRIVLSGSIDINVAGDMNRGFSVGVDLETVDGVTIDTFVISDFELNSPVTVDLDGPLAVDDYLQEGLRFSLWTNSGSAEFDGDQTVSIDIRYIGRRAI